jgi:alkaline phosphatase D
MRCLPVFAYCTLIALLLFACTAPSPTVTDGPYFGNGFRSGWADQQSAVIWTRLTTIPDGRDSDVHFLEISRQESDSLGELKDVEMLNRSQLPEGVSLDQVHGACPGASGEVKLRYYPEQDQSAARETEWAAVDPGKNYTHQWQLEQLSAGTTYQLELLARKDEASAVSDTFLGRLQTAPDEQTARPLHFSIVSCHDYDRKDTTDGHKIYAAMMQDDLDFYIHTGDIEYYDKPNPYAFTEDLMRFKWDRLFALPLQRQFYAGTTSYFMKDDHDILYDDAFPGMTYGPVTFERGLEIFDREQFPSRDTTYQTIRWGKDLQIWILEGRRYRSKNTDPDGPAKTILGEEQKQWLFETLKASDATFKVIVSASPVLGPDRPRGKNDNHSNKAFQTEGDEIRAFIDQFDNVYLCNGDRHWQYVTHFEDTNLWEFGCGAGADQHAGGWSQDNVKPEHRFLRVKGGYLFGMVSYENDQPRLHFQHRDVDGRTVHEEVFTP